MNQEEQVCALYRNVELTYHCQIECTFCADILEAVCEHSANMGDFADHAYLKGWRYIVYPKFGAEGTACPSCVEECSTETGVNC